MPKHKKKSKKKAPPPPPPDSTAPKVPKTFVFKKGKVGKAVKELVLDVRKTMEPHTAINLQESQGNALRDFLAVAGQFGVSHFLVFSCTDMATYLRVAKVPQGPTLTFRIHEFALMRDVVQLQLRPHSPSFEFLTPPLVVLNNFGSDEKHIRLASIIVQGMFPAINVQTVQLSECKRVVLFHFVPETQRIEFRHYVVSLSPVGLSKSIKRIIQGRIPNLDNVDDISEWVLRNTGASESDAEDNGEGRVVMPDDYGRTKIHRKLNTQEVKHEGDAATNQKSKQNAVRLQEMGPRMTMELVKVEDKFCGGDVLFHAYVKKTADEIEDLKKKKRDQEAQRKQRKAVQEANVKRKEEEKSKHGNKPQGSEKEPEPEVEATTAPEAAIEEDIDDREWYRREVGEEPDDELFSRQAPERKREKYNPLYKRKKRNEDEGGDGGDDKKRGFKGKGKGDFGNKGGFGKRDSFGKKGGFRKGGDGGDGGKRFNKRRSDGPGGFNKRKKSF